MAFRSDVVSGIRLAAILFAAFLCGIAGYRIFATQPRAAQSASPALALKDALPGTLLSDRPTGLADGPAGLAARPSAADAGFPPPPPARTAPVHRTPYPRTVSSPFHGRLNAAYPPPPPSLEKPPQKQGEVANTVSADRLAENAGGDSRSDEASPSSAASGSPKPAMEESPPVETTAAEPEPGNSPAHWVKAVGHFFHLGARKYVAPEAVH